MTLPDQKAREQIASDLAFNLMVEAPAGSGKTQSLSSRMVAGLRSGRYRTGEMAAVTFTRKAASELRGRLQLALEQAIAEEPSPLLSQALQELDRMFLGTVHSFCASLVREVPVEAGITPGFRETDEAEDQTLRNFIFRRCLEEPEGVAVRRELSESGAAPEDLLDALAIVCDNGEVDFPPGNHPRPDVEAAWKAVDQFAEEIEGLLPRSVQAVHTTCELFKRSDQFLGKKSRASRDLFNLVGLLSLFEREPKSVQKWWGESPAERRANCDRALARANAFREQIAEPFLRDWKAFLYTLCTGFLQTVRERYREERRRRGLLNFNDLLTIAARLLRERPEVRERLQRRYRWLFVDEFQDTDPIQAEVLFLLAARPGQEESDWSQLELRPGALFIVGDPKQSIYRFRRADIETYNQVRERMDRTVTLSASFRSLPGLCEWTNRVFSRLLPEEPTDEQAAFSPLVPVKTGQARLWRSPVSSERYSQTSDCEAPKVAEWISGAIASGDYRAGDFLLLTMRREHLSLYAQALAERAVPCEVTGGHASADEEVGALFELLSVLSDPQDEVSLVGVLRGTLFGIDDDTLYRHRLQGGAFYPSDQGERVVNQALQRLRAMHQLLGRLPIGAAVEKVLEDSGLLALAAARPGGAAELLQIADALRLACSEGLTFSEALRGLLSVRQERPLALDCGRSDVVRLMNLHQAKGLEARVVFLVAPTGGLAVRADRRILRAEGGARGFLTMRNQYRIFAQPPDWPEHEAAEIGYLNAERIRLLYVAATRAREQLVVSQWTGTHGSAHRPWAAFDEFLGEADELPPALEPSRPRKRRKHPPVCDWESARELSWRRTSVTASNHEERLQVWSAPIPEEALSSERPDAGAAWGELIHRLLEQLMRKPSLGSDELARLARWFTFESPELSQLIPLALETVEQVKTTPFWARAMQAGQRLVEVPFGARVEDRLIFGVLDLALQQEEGWELVDYKTDRRSLDELVARYAGQVEQYAEHWAKLAPEPVRYAGLYGIREGKLSEDLAHGG
ncbi:MAG: ATP-dependent DNA helicase [Candidatus Xenobia bacterium]